jgi:hypothetical protein
VEFRFFLKKQEDMKVEGGLFEKKVTRRGGDKKQ